MNATLPLLRREWLQHRLGWSLLAAIPIGLALVFALFGHLEVDAQDVPPPQQMPLVLAMVPVIGGTMLMFMIAAGASLLFTFGLARRDHADRSVEFWMSLPVSHARSLAVPIATHLLLVPAVALVLGWLAGQLAGFIVVGRVLSPAQWFALPWSALMPAMLAMPLRLLGGLPLAVLWVLPLVLPIVLLGARFGRWGWVVALIVFGVLKLMGQFVPGRSWMADTVADLLRHAGQSLMGASHRSFAIRKGADPVGALQQLPALAGQDFLAALSAAFSPLMLGGLVFSAACFWLLVKWRERGAGGAG